VRIGTKSRRARLFGGGNPPSPERAAHYFNECVMAHHTQGAGGGERSGMIGVGRGELVVASTGSVWGSSGHASDAQPVTEGALKNLAGHGEGLRSWEGLEEGSGSSAADAMEA
jgi:hypothetical protein